MSAYKNKYELKPSSEQHQKSFYGRAIVYEYLDGREVLFSYGTKILEKLDESTFIRVFDDWSKTTGKHVKAFSGLNKKGFFALPYKGD